METMFMQNFGGTNKEYYGIFKRSIDFLMSNHNGSKEEATPVIDRIINISECLELLLICAHALYHFTKWQGKVRGAL